MQGTPEQAIAQLSRRVAGMVFTAVIHEVDYPNYRLRARVGQMDGPHIITNWMRWPGNVGRNRVDWMPLAVGQQVMVVSQSGTMADCVVVQLLHTTDDPPPSLDPTKDVIRFRTGTQVVHDADTGDLAITCAGDVTINVTGNARVVARRIDLN